MKILRRRFGAKASDTNLADWARELKITYNKARQWERGSFPKGGSDELVKALSNCQAIKRPEELAAWVLTGIGAGPTTPETPPGGTKITEAIMNATATMLAGWAPVTIRLANMARQSSDPSEVESIRDEILQMLVEDHRRGCSSVGRAAAFYSEGSTIELVTVGSEIDGSAQSPFGIASTALTPEAREARTKNAA